MMKRSITLAPRWFLALAVAAAIAAPSTSHARSSGEVSRFLVDQDGAYSFARKHENADNLHGTLEDSSNTLPVRGIVRSNLLLHDAQAPEHIFDGATTPRRTTSHVCAVHGKRFLRLNLVRELFLAADLRHLFVRHTKDDSQNGGASYPQNGIVDYRGTFSH